MKTVAQLLTSKQKQNVYTIAPTTTVDDALSLMALRNIGALPVVENGRLIGIVSDARLRAQGSSTWAFIIRASGRHHHELTSVDWSHLIKPSANVCRSSQTNICGTYQW